MAVTVGSLKTGRHVAKRLCLISKQEAEKQGD